MTFFRSPANLMMSAVYACAVLVAAALWITLHYPSIGLRFEATAAGEPVRLLAADGHELARLAPTTPVTFTGPAGSAVAQADTLPPIAFTYGKAAQTSFVAFQDRLAPLLHAPLTISAAGRSYAAAPARRGFADIGYDFWLMMAGGIGGFLIGVWVWALKPSHWGARMFAVSGLGLMLAATGTALAFTREVAGEGHLVIAAIALNTIGTFLCGFGMISQFLIYPTPLVRPRVLAGVGLASLLFVGGLLAFDTPLLPTSAAIMVEFVVLVVLIGLQWRAARIDPVARAALRWIGLATLLGSVAFVAIDIGPMLMGALPLVSPGIGYLVLFGIYAGMAVGVGRYRLFDLDRWAYRIVMAVAATLALMAVDAGLVFGLRLAAPQALGAALMLTGLIYLPVRGAVWRLVVGRPQVSDSQMFQIAEEARFTPPGPLRQERWRALLTQLFDPLEVTPAKVTVADPQIRDDGVELVIPAAAGEPALALRYAAKGRKLFSQTEADLASQLVSLMAKADTVRDGYLRGVAEERGRIARDLHDDVSGMLLTSLSRPDASALKADVRAALADIRSIIRGLGGEAQAASRVLANLRHETSMRLEAAGLDLDWPTFAPPDADPMLDAFACKNLTSAHREVVTNIIRHAGATRVLVTTALDRGGLHITIEDDGIGLPADIESASGGLRNIRRRLTDVGGAATLERGDRGLKIVMFAPAAG